MAAFLLFLLISSIKAATSQRNITLGSSLSATSNTSWPSPSGLFAFGFFPQQNASAIGIFISAPRTITVVWTANANNPTVPNDAVLRLTPDGRLILQHGQDQVKDVIAPSEPIHYGSMLDNGNFVLYNSDSRIIWQSFDSPTDTLLTGQRLPPNRELISSVSETDRSRGFFRLKMQGDGNLVQYPVNTPDTYPYAYYSSGTSGDGSNVSLNLASDGRLYLLNGSTFLQNITTGGLPSEGTIHLVRIDPDGIFRTYSRSLNGSWAMRWSSTDDECTPKGRCGMNAYCLNIDRDANCVCLPGFDFLLPGNWTAGCVRDFMDDACGERNSRVRYEMRTAENTVWEDNSYTTLSVPTAEGCEQACLDDCNCEAAFYNREGWCSKQRLPLRYGRRQLSDSNVALIKVSRPRGGNTDGVHGGQPTKQIKKEVRLDILIISIALAALGFLGMVASVIYVRRNYQAYKRIAGSPGEVNLIEGIALRAFTYSEIAQATNGFKEEIGKGASGTVYKGVLPDSQKVIAVKMLSKDLAQGEKEFQTEIKTIGKTYHRNLVRLLGYSLDGPKKLLVLEYMGNGSLADMLFKSETRPSWEDRTRFARDIARGILYLHEECETQIIHCDIKPQNILMDEHGCAKISDFGLAKLLKQDQTNTYTGIRGTRGYVAPEWHQQQRVSVKADVYSFGILLLEIICCRRCVDSSLSEDEVILQDWVYDCYWEGKIGKLLGEEYEQMDKRKAERMLKIGIWCIQEEPSLRPSMKKVLLMLEGTVDIPVPPSPKSFFSAAV